MIEKLIDLPKEIKQPQDINTLKQADLPRTQDLQTKAFIPRENGRWTDVPGDSTWKPDSTAIPKKDNPEGKTWGEILIKYDIDGIEFKDGDPDFSPVAQHEVKIENFTEDRSKNFAQADKKLAEELGISPREVKELREKEGYTWHECKDCKTMQLVPKEIHNNIPHAGGISEMKKINANK